jgi:dGTPase
MNHYSLASYAISEEQSKGRFYKENYDDAKYRSLFGKDRDRIINSSAFRRLQYKTQVFVNHEGDHYRTRLTHTLEMAQIARWISGALNINKDLSEVISLAHDLGHPPFGHAGEEELNRKMQNFGGFYHNVHTLKIITKLENRFIDFEGLNLTFETLEGVIKHNGAFLNYDKVNKYILDLDKIYDFQLTKSPSLEAQISSISDDIAYNNHDIEDGLRANLFTIADLYSIPLIGDIYKELVQKNPNLRQELLVGEAKKRITLAMVVDVIENTQYNLIKNKINNLNDVINFPYNLISFSKDLEEVHRKIKDFLMQNMYRHPKVNQMTINAQNIINFLFDKHFGDPKKLPADRYDLFKNNEDPKNLANIICDYIAGMTDRYAIKACNI